MGRSNYGCPDLQHRFAAVFVNRDSRGRRSFMVFKTDDITDSR